MNIQQLRLANTQHILTMQRGGARVNPNEYRIGESLRTKQDVDLQVDEAVVTVPSGSVATIRRMHDGASNIVLDLGEALGGEYTIPMGDLTKYFERVPKTESAVKARRSLSEANPTTATPGRLVQITSYDERIGPNRGPKSPGHGGYQSLIGQRGMMNTLFGMINGIKTYKIQLVSGGEFVFAETEFTVLNESAVKMNMRALHALGFGL